MSSELPMPTRGPVLIEHDRWFVDPDHDERFGVISVAVNALDTAYIPCDQTATKESEANAHLIAAAFNAATAAADLGYDPIASLEALPELLRALDYADRTLYTPTVAKGMDYDHSADCPQATKSLWRAAGTSLGVIARALAAARTRKAVTA